MNLKYPSKDQIKVYKSEGILVSNGFLDNKEKNKICKAIFSVLSKYISLEDESILDEDIENVSLHESLINFRNKKPKEFGNFYDELTLNASIRSIFYSEKFMAFYSNLLGVSQENLFINGFMLRLDGPFDNRNTLDWHQDGQYYEQTYPEFNACVCWLPITRNSEKNGTLKFIPKTHLEYKKTKKEKLGQAFSTQYKNLPEINELKKIKNFNADFGDMGVFHMNLKHASGKNSSSKFRITLGCRFHDTSSKFNLGQELYVYNDSKEVSLFLKK